MKNDVFLVDTSTWLLALRKEFVPEVKELLDRLLRENSVITTGIIKLEIIGGARTEYEFQRLKSRFNALDAVKTDEPVWQKACELGFALRRKGVTIPHTDILIAACSLQSGSVIVHADAHFDLIAGHAGIKVESLVHILRGKGL
jgi:predicted nucleic acid-binding protein